MKSLLVALLVLFCAIGAAAIGMRMRKILPEEHLGSDSKDAIKLGMGLIATMAALVLGLLIGSAKSSYDTQGGELRQMAANVLMLDRTLSYYGAAGEDARNLLHQTIGTLLNNVWRHDSTRESVFDAPETNSFGVQMFEKLEKLTPTTDTQKAIKSEATTLMLDIARERWLLLSQEGSAIPLPFLAVLVFWLTFLFGIFGLFTPYNHTVLVVFLVCAFSVAGAIFLILELDTPFGGLMHLSNAPFRKVLGE